MINVVRTWTRKPSAVSQTAMNRTKPAGVTQKEAKPRIGFFESFYRMWETQADLVVRNINKEG